MANLALYGLIGAGGFGREVMPLARAQLAPLIAQGAAELVFVVEGAPPNTVINGFKVIPLDEFLSYSGDRYFNVAITSGEVRSRIAMTCTLAGARPFSVIAATAVIMDEVDIGEGAIVCGFVNLLSNVKIGRYFHANIYSYVAHDCVIGDFVTFAPRVACNGRSRIEDHVYVGTGAIMRDGTPTAPFRVGTKAIIGMGAVVTRNVSAGSTVYGNPARPFEKKSD